MNTDKIISERHEEIEKMGLTDRMIACYAGFVVRFPWLIILVILIMVAICGGVAFTQVELPDFTQPTKGFEARGTYISGARQNYKHLRHFLTSNLENSRNDHQGPMKELDSNLSMNNIHNTTQKESPFNSKNCENMDNSNICITRVIETRQVKQHFIKFAFAATDGSKSLFTRDALFEICRFEDDVIKPFLHAKHKQYPKNCRGLSLGLLVGLLAGNKDCLKLTDNDVSTVQDLLVECSDDYFRGTLQDNPLCNTTLFANNIIYLIFHYLTDSDFLSGESEKRFKLTYTLLLHEFEDLYGPFYKEQIEGKKRIYHHAKLIAIGEEIKKLLFNDYVIKDLIFFAIAFVLIIIAMVLYLRSTIITVATIFNITFSLIISYFFYHIVFEFTFFPFMNVLTGLILIAVGADDVFVFMDIWLEEKQLQDGNLEIVLKRTLKSASASIFVTSLTTASAFLANLVSEITSIKCFGVFSAITLLINFCMMITWVPAVVVLFEKLSQYYCDKTLKYFSCCIKMEDMFHKFRILVFNHGLPYIIGKLWFLWIILLLLLGTGGLVAIFAVPKLSLPSTKTFQFFSSNHILELYDLDIKAKFRFTYDPVYNLVLTYVFGLKGRDNGNHYDPDSQGFLEFDNNLKISNPAVQRSLHKFCEDLIKAPFLSKYSKTTINCTLSLLKDFVAMPCSNVSNVNSPCCDQDWPLPTHLFDRCMYDLYSMLETIGVNPGRLVGKPYVLHGETKIKAFDMVIVTDTMWSASYQNMSEFHHEVKSFLEDSLRNSYGGVYGAFVIYFGTEFYDLQRALSSGTYTAVGVSLICATVVMVLTTLNLLVSFYAIITITMAIAVTIGTLVLLGWQLNILESVIISLAVGMSIDFTIHYGVAYILSQNHSRKDCTRESISVVGSAVAMSAFTTFIAGASVVSSQVLSYSQFGTFLMLVIAFSWVYATFMFQSLCYKFGPKGSFAQIPNPCLCCRNKYSNSKKYQTQIKSIKDPVDRKRHVLNKKLDKNSVYTVGQAKVNPVFECDSSDSGIHEESERGNSNSISACNQSVAAIHMEMDINGVDDIKTVTSEEVNCQKCKQ